MNKKYLLNLLIFGFCVSVSFFLWMGMLGCAYVDGFLVIEVVENTENKEIMFDFVVLCMYPTIMGGFCMHSIILDEIKKWRVKIENKNKN